MQQCGVFSLEILGSGALGTRPSIVASSDNERILFDCGDGTQRLCTENGVRVSRISRVYTSTVGAASTGGLGGFLLTRSDLPACDKTEIVGPPGMAQLIRSYRYFYQRPQCLLSVYEIGNENVPQTTGDGIIVDPVLVGGSAHVLHSSSREKRAKTTQPPEVGRGFELFLSPLGVSTADELDYAASYILTLPERRGKFHPQRAASLGVQPGKDFGRLAKGECVTTASGKIVRPEDCMDASETPPVCMIINCPSISHFEALRAHPKITAVLETKRDHIQCVIHTSAPEALESEAYQHWCKSFAPQVTHMAVGERFSPQRSLYRASSRICARLSALESRAFQLCEPSGHPQKAAGVCQGVDTLAKYVVLPIRTRGVDVSAVPPYIDTAEELSQATAALGITPSSTNPPLPQSVGNQSNDTPELIFLGTGSAIPSKYRNVSSFVIKPSSSEHGCIFVDCGEGSVAQLARVLGSMDAAREMISRAAGVWISHMHADHHLGVLTLLEERHKVAPGQPLTVAGPTQLNSLIVEYARALGFEKERSVLSAMTFLDNEALLHHKQVDFQPPALRAFKAAAGLKSLVSVPVAHCYRAYGLVAETFQGWKMVYSGDTEFCPELVRQGMGATVLVHEATFEDGKEDEAKEKRHSTISQALRAGVEMEAKCILFTHFSQRYPKNPPLPADAPAHTPTVFAFDLMRFRPEFAVSLAAKAKDFERLLEAEVIEGDE